LKGHINIARLKFPKGTLGADIDALARCHLWNSGLDYQHSTGHGVGSFLSVHEGPYGISKRSKTILNSGMIISNEPGLYIENQYGIRLENLMLVQEFDKNFLQFETLTLVPFELDLIDFKMITYPERKWLINYHHKILNEVILNQNNFDHHEIQWFKEHYIEPLNFL
jgi:Xaa-Pro aminopeptidase